MTQQHSLLSQVFSLHVVKNYNINLCAFESEQIDTQQHQCLLHHTSAWWQSCTCTEAGFKNGSAIVGLIEMSFQKCMCNRFSKAGPTEHLFRCFISAHLLTTWKSWCKSNEVHHGRNSLADLMLSRNGVMQYLVLKLTIYLSVQVWGLGNFLCCRERLFSGGCSWKSPLAGQGCRNLRVSCNYIGLRYLPKVVGQLELGEYVFQIWAIPLICLIYDFS